MRADCHMHMILDGIAWRSAIARHKEKPDEAFIRKVLTIYKDLGYTYLRDGGDRWGAGKRAREMSAEYGIAYRTPLAPWCKKGHYGAFIGLSWEGGETVFCPERRYMRTREQVRRQAASHAFDLIRREVLGK